MDKELRKKEKEMRKGGEKDKNKGGLDFYDLNPTGEVIFAKNFSKQLRRSHSTKREVPEPFLVQQRPSQTDPMWVGGIGLL